MLADRHGHKAIFPEPIWRLIGRLKQKHPRNKLVLYVSAHMSASKGAEQIDVALSDLLTALDADVDAADSNSNSKSSGAL